MSRQWLNQHISDPYVKQAQKDRYFSRAAYKLLSLNEQNRLFKPGMRVFDLGASPGGWSQVAQEKVGERGQVIALDLLPMKQVPGVTFIQGDFREKEILDRLLETLSGCYLDVLISDMAPNLSGNKSIDQPRSMCLAELAWDCAQKTLRLGGNFLVKVFQGEGSQELVSKVKSCFKTVRSRKPDVSRSRSREFYLVGLAFRG